MSRGPCAKRRVVCHLMTGEGPTFTGENDCANPQTVCPRLPGEGYEKCRSVCDQAGHAEVQALDRAKAAGIETDGAIAVLEGHYWMCEPCGRALREAGVRAVKIVLAQ